MDNKDIAASLGYKLVGKEGETEKTVEQAPVENILLFVCFNRV